MSGAYLSLLLADGRLPTGAHTQSAGVEPALRHGMGLVALPDYVAARLTTVTEVEAAAAVVARHVWRQAAGRRRPGSGGPGLAGPNGFGRLA